MSITLLFSFRVRVTSSPTLGNAWPCRSDAFVVTAIVLPSGILTVSNPDFSAITTPWIVRWCSPVLGPSWPVSAYPAAPFRNNKAPAATMMIDDFMRTSCVSDVWSPPGRSGYRETAGSATIAVVFPSKWSSVSASASCLVRWIVPSLCSGGL